MESARRTPGAAPVSAWPWKPAPPAPPTANAAPTRSAAEGPAWGATAARPATATGVDVWTTAARSPSSRRALRTTMPVQQMRSAPKARPAWLALARPVRLTPSAAPTPAAAPGSARQAPAVGTRSVGRAAPARAARASAALPTWSAALRRNVVVVRVSLATAAELLTAKGAPAGRTPVSRVRIPPSAGQPRCAAMACVAKGPAAPAPTAR